jgi:transcriptional regulator with XRE-family HTH domain
MTRKGNKHLGVRIRQLREAKDLNQREFAMSAGVDQGLLSRIEAGTGNPGLLTLTSIAKALGITASELLKGVE